MTVQVGFILAHTAFRKHLKVQSSISSMQILSTYFWSAFGPDVNFVQNLPDAFCIELNTCGSTAVTGADRTEVGVCSLSLCSVKNVTHWFSGGHQLFLRTN